MEPATFRLVAQCLSQLHRRLPHIRTVYSIMLVTDVIKYKTLFPLKAFTYSHRAQGCAMAQVVTLQLVTEETWV
jgi:hypothetical protein